MLKNSSKGRSKNKKMNPEIKRKLFFQGLIVFVYTIMALLICAVFFLCDIPAESVYYIILAVLGFSAFASGYIIGKKEKKNGLAVGVMYNLVPIVIVMISSLVLNSFTFDYRLVVTLAVLVIFSAVGGITAVNSRRKSR